MQSGWFPNPTNPDEEVFWDGSAWTEETRSKQSGSVNAARPDDAVSNMAAEAQNLARANSVDTQGGKRRRRLWIAIATVVALLIAGGITAAVLAQDAHNHQVAVAKAVAAKKLAEQRAADKAAAQQAADDAERALRKATVTEVEASVKKMATDDVTKGVIDGPVLSASCSPVSGSTDTLTDRTTSFNCFVATKDNGDGTQTGYNFNATVNWDTGSYTYGFGKAG
jgi:hypothetical protein